MSEVRLSEAELREITGADTKVFLVRPGDPRGYAEGYEPDIKRFLVGGHANRKPSHFVEAFEVAFEHALHKTHHEEPNEALFFRFGIMVRIRTGSAEASYRAVSELGEYFEAELKSSHVVHIVNEGKHISVRIGLGQYEKPTKFSRAVSELSTREETLQAYVSEIRRYTDDDDFSWYPYWDWTDDSDSYGAATSAA